MNALFVFANAICGSLAFIVLIHARLEIALKLIRTNGLETREGETFSIMISMKRRLLSFSCGSIGWLLLFSMVDNVSFSRVILTSSLVDFYNRVLSSTPHSYTINNNNNHKITISTHSD